MTKGKVLSIKNAINLLKKITIVIPIKSIKNAK